MTTASLPAYPAAVLGSALGATVVTLKPSASISSAAADPSAPATRTLGAADTRTEVPMVLFCGAGVAFAVDRDFVPVGAGVLRRHHTEEEGVVALAELRHPGGRRRRRCDGRLAWPARAPCCAPSPRSRAGRPRAAPRGDSSRVTAASTGSLLSATVSSETPRSRAAAARPSGSPVVCRPSERRTTRPPLGVRASATSSAPWRSVCRPSRLPLASLAQHFGPRPGEFGAAGELDDVAFGAAAFVGLRARRPRLRPSAGPTLSERSSTSVVGGGEEPEVGSKRATATRTRLAAWRPMIRRRRRGPPRSGSRQSE